MWKTLVCCITESCDLSLAPKNPAFGAKVKIVYVVRLLQVDGLKVLVLRAQESSFKSFSLSDRSLLGGQRIFYSEADIWQFDAWISGDVASFSKR